MTFQECLENEAKGGICGYLRIGFDDGRVVEPDFYVFFTVGKTRQHYRLGVFNLSTDNQEFFTLTLEDMLHGVWKKFNPGIGDW